MFFNHSPIWAVVDEYNRSLLNKITHNPHTFDRAVFNRFKNNESVWFHADNAIRHINAGLNPIRTYLSCTLFLSQANEYEGGELVVEDTSKFTHGTRRSSQ